MMKETVNLMQSHMRSNVEKTVSNWEKNYRAYRKWFITAGMIAMLVFLIIGWWMELLITYLVCHFQVAITENWWKMKAIETMLEKRDAKD